MGAISRSQGHTAVLDVSVGLRIVYQAMQANWLRFGTLILFLTVMQVFLSIAQVVGSFK